MSKIFWLGVGAAAVYLLTKKEARSAAPVIVAPILPTVTPAGPIVSAGGPAHPVPVDLSHPPPCDRSEFLSAGKCYRAFFID